jgi:hypothetical protein
MAGPEDPRNAANPPNPPSFPPPPGEFLTPELESDTARFLDELRQSISRREASRAGLSFG